ncbi:MAG: hypothetical protein LBI76_07010, partial [Comamonas sp.]|nr:hypothetical protein [Comamonas sp.]
MKKTTLGSNFVVCSAGGLDQLLGVEIATEVEQRRHPGPGQRRRSRYGRSTFSKSFREWRSARWPIASLSQSGEV